MSSEERLEALSAKFDKPCARGGDGWCGKPPNNPAHRCLTAYCCDGDHEADQACHIYLCPTHGNNGVTDSRPECAGQNGYWYCGPCRIGALLSVAQKLRDEIDVSDALLNHRNELLREIPECEAHGDQCVPHAKEWIRRHLPATTGQ